MQKDEQERDVAGSFSAAFSKRKATESTYWYWPIKNIYENLWCLKIHTPMILKPFRYSWRGWACGTQPARTTFFFPSWAFLKKDKQWVIFFFLNYHFQLQHNHIVHMTTESNHNEDLAKLEATCAWFEPQKPHKPTHQKTPVWSYSTPGLVWGVCTETTTTAYLGQKHNLERPNGVH